tara:strand:+ start:319 stop:582 length:264 start_codon:yes stop_codon:yes gene_type:complete
MYLANLKRKAQRTTFTQDYQIHRTTIAYTANRKKFGLFEIKQIRDIKLASWGLFYGLGAEPQKRLKRVYFHASYSHQWRMDRVSKIS